MFYLTDLDERLAGGYPIRIRFEHFPREYGPFYQGFTRAILEVSDGNGKWDRGPTSLSYCSYSDQFNRATGRKVALTHLLRQLTIRGMLSKADRASIWHDYWRERERVGDYSRKG